MAAKRSRQDETPAGDPGVDPVVDPVSASLSAGTGDEGETTSSETPDGSVGGRRRPRGRRGGRRRRPAAKEGTGDGRDEAPVQEEVADRADDDREAAAASAAGGVAGDSDGATSRTADGESAPAAPRSRSRRGRRRRSRPVSDDGAVADASQEERAAAGLRNGEEPPAPPGERPARDAGAAVTDGVTAGPKTGDASTEAAAEDSSPGSEEAPSGSARPRTRRGRRRKKPKSEAPVAEGVVEDTVGPQDRDAEAPAAGEPQTGREIAEAGSEPAPEEKRRRKRRTPAPAPVDESDQHATKGEAPRPRRRSRTTARAAASESSERIVLASEDLGDLRVAVVEDGRLAAVYLQRQERPSILGNIYQARVQSVLKGMDASFIDFGLEKNGFLHVDEVTLPDEEGGKRSRRITSLLQSGQELLVQVTKDPMKGKGARLTTRVSLPGRYLVYVPGGSGVGVSRRLGQDERDRLRDLCRQLRPRNAGLIVRTVAEGKGLEELRRDLQYLSRLWTRIKTKAAKTAAPALIYEEADVALTAARDLVDEACTRFVIDSPKVRKGVVAYLERVAPELVERVVLYDGEQPLFEEYGVEDGIDATLARRAPLPSGGNLVIDHTEALTVVDVNSGRYTGGKGLEETITRTNLEAAEELVRQLRLRDIGGIIVIDFIDMSRRENREAVLQKLETALARDKTKTYVVEISPLGLVEMTRQSTTNGTRGLMTVTCPTCNGTARVLTAESMVRDVERLLARTLPNTAGDAVLIEVRRDVADKLTETDRLRRLERQYGRRLFFEGSAQLPVDTFRIVSSGPLRTVQGQRLPVREGQDLEVELLHTLPHSPRDAVAVVDGYSIVVRSGRPHLGARRKVRVETALRTGGVADLL